MARPDTLAKGYDTARNAFLRTYNYMLEVFIMVLDQASEEDVSRWTEETRLIIVIFVCPTRHGTMNLVGFIFSTAKCAGSRE